MNNQCFILFVTFVVILINENKATEITEEYKNYAINYYGENHCTSLCQYNPNGCKKYGNRCGTLMSLVIDYNYEICLRDCKVGGIPRSQCEPTKCIYNAYLKVARKIPDKAIDLYYNNIRMGINNTYIGCRL